MKTMQEIKSLSWKQLNFALACSIYGAENVVYGKQQVTAIPTNSDAAFKFDYMDWSLIMPKFVEHKLLLDSGRESYVYACTDCGMGAVSTDKIPQRAIAEVLLYVMQEQS